MDDLRQTLEHYRRDCEEEAATVALFIDFLHRNGAASFHRTLAEGHVTASCWLLNPDQSCVLLTQHRKLNRWLQLGGHADGDPQPLHVAINEAREESGIDDLVPLLGGRLFDLERHRVPANANEAQHYHYDFRFVLHAGSDHYTISAESQDMRWVALNRLGRYTRDASILRMRRKWLAYRARDRRG